MKILVTGAGGFIANYLIEILLGKGIEVVATSLNPQKVEKKRWFEKVRYIPFNLLNSEEEIDFFKYFDSPDKVIHLAWQGLPDYKNSNHTDVYLPSHYNFLHNLILNGVKDLTVAGTCLEYGMKEGELSEEDYCEPSNAYADAKLNLFKSLQLLQYTNSFLLKWPRIFYLYGLGQHPNSLYSLMNKAVINNESEFKMSMGDQTRDFLPVELAAEYISEISLNSEFNGVVNCCSGKPVKVVDFVEEFFKEKEYNIKLNKGFYPYPDYEPKHFWGNNSLLKQILKL